MALKDITQKEVKAAIKEFDKEGSEEILRKYGGGKSRQYYLEYNGKYYDQKLIARVAHGYLLGEQPLKARGRGNQRANGTKTKKHLEKLGFNIVDINSFHYRDISGNLLPEEVDSSIKYKEGATKTVTINAYERNTGARRKCLQHRGYKCSVCSFNFEDFYGTIGKNYIHVHHVIPLAEIKAEYEIDPVNDLVPICPNCHAMIHKTRETLTIEQLKQYLAEKAGKT